MGRPLAGSAVSERSRQLRFARPREGHGPRGHRRQHGPAVGWPAGVLEPRRCRARTDDVPGVPPLSSRLLRALSRPAHERDSRVVPRCRRLCRGDRAVQPRGLAGRHLSDRSSDEHAGRPRLGSDLGGGRGERPHDRHPHVHAVAPVPARCLGHLGQHVPPALGEPRVERPAQHGGDHRERRARSLSETASHVARVWSRMARVLGVPARRAGRDDPPRAAGAQAEAERVRSRSAVLPEHPASRG